MSIIARLEGDIYSHCWFYNAARKSFEYTDFGDTCGGITGISLTAFMLENYFNLSCKKIFDVGTRVNEILNSPPNYFREVIEKPGSDLDVRTIVIDAYSFQHQINTLSKVFENI